MSCGVGRRHGLDLAFLWLWCRLAAAAPIGPLTWEPPYAMDVTLKRQKKKKKKKRIPVYSAPNSPQVTILHNHDKIVKTRKLTLIQDLTNPRTLFEFHQLYHYWIFSGTEYGTSRWVWDVVSLVSFHLRETLVLCLLWP